MTMQAELSTGAPTELAKGDPHKPRRTVAVVVGLLLALGGTTVGVVEARDNKVSRGHGVTLGQSLRPLPVYRTRATGLQTSAARPGVSQQVLPLLGLPGRATVADRQSTLSLHVRYAHVEPALGAWQIEFTATEGSTFNLASTQGKFYAVVVDGHALILFFSDGNPDGTQFAVGGGPNRMSRDQAIALANSLTTAVRITS